MRRLALTTAVAAGLFALACTDEREAPTEPSTKAAASPCPSTDPIQSQICNLFGATDLLKSASDFYNNIQTKKKQNKDAEAQARATDLVNFTFKQFYAGKLIGGSSSTTQANVVTLTCDVLRTVGSGWTECEADLGPGLTSTPSSPHSTVQVCGPAGCLVRPEDKHSGVSVPPEACPTLCIISVDLISPNHASPRDGPLSHLTNLDQYPLFRELNLIAPFDEFDFPVIVGICHLSPSDGGPFAPPDDATEKRLRLAHPNPDTEVGGIEILAPVAAPFLDCSDLFASNDEFTPIIGGRSLHWGGFASAAETMFRRAVGPVLQALLPEPAEAAVLGSCCLGGATTKFSPWAAVDPESGGEVIFFNDADFGDGAWDPGGQTFQVDQELQWDNTIDGSTFSQAFPAVEVLDANGDSQSGVTVTVSLVQVTGTGTLYGPSQATSGESSSAEGSNAAVFEDLMISQTEDGGTYRLRFTAPGLTPKDSGVFTVEGTSIILTGVD